MFDWLVRPKNDNGWGLHDDGISGPGTMPRIYSLLDQMQDKNLHWITFVFNVTTEKLPLIRYALDRDIMPLIRPFEQPCHPNSRMQEEWVKACIDEGAVYFIDWNEPNLGGVECTRPYNEYKYDDGKVTGHPAFVSRLLDQWMQDADTVRRCGGIPLLFPMSPTSYTSNSVYFHHRLYAELVGLAKLRNNLHWAFEKTGIAIHNRPCGGQYLDKVDRCAYGDYKWVEELFEEALGRPIPLFGTESGYESGMVTAHLANYHGLLQPNSMTILEYHKRLNHEIFARFNPAHEKPWADYLICQNMWLSHDAAASWPGSGWKLNQLSRGEAPAWRDMHELPYFVRAETEPDPEPDPQPDPDPPPPPPPPDIEFVGLSQEMIERLTIEPPPDWAYETGYWKVTRVEIQPNTDSQSAFGILPTDGHHALFVNFFWSNGSHIAECKADPYAPVGARQFAGSMAMFASWGGYGVYVDAGSERISGFGLYGDNLELTHTAHHPVLVYFERVEGEDPPPPPPPPPPDEYTIFDACERWGLNPIDKRLTCARHAHLDRVQTRKPRAWNGIVIHHTASNYSGQTPESIAIDHTKAKDHGGRGFASIAYHFLIGFEGERYFTAPVSWATDHCGGLEMETIGVAVMGDFTSEEPNDGQIEALRRLILALQDWLGRGKPKRCYVLPHCYVWPTPCPGALKDKLMEGAWPIIS